MTSQNPFRILHLPQTATIQDIKSRYRHLTKLLHPDKQPLQNYTLAKIQFEKIDNAYKCISNPLRKFIFLEFGELGIRVLQENLAEFFDFKDLDHLDENNKINIREIMVYLLYESHANSQSDKGKFHSKTLLNLKELTYINQNVQSRIPNIEKTDFDVELPLPDFKTITNSLSISYKNIPNKQSKGQEVQQEMRMAVSSVLRTSQSNLLNSTVAFSNDSIDYTFAVEKTISNSLQARFIPIILENDKLQNPRIAFDKVYEHFNISAITDFQTINIDVGTNKNNTVSGRNSKLNYSSRIMIESKAIALVPRLQYDLNNSLKLFGQVMISGEGTQQGVGIRYNPIYGYKLKLHDNLTIQLTSHLGQRNFLQLSIFSAKFKASIPIMYAFQSQLNCQLVKLLIMTGGYLSFVLCKSMNQQRKKNRQKMIQSNHNRLVIEKTKINRLNDQYQNISRQNQIRQIKYRGLIILSAFIGSKRAVRKLQSTFRSRRKLPKFVQGSLEQLLENWKNEDFVFGQIQDQLYDITDYVQGSVIGSQLLHFTYENANPCIDQNQQPYCYIQYWLRGSQSNIFFEANKPINIGKPAQKRSKFEDFVHHITKMIF